jgi:hypothetical protein
MTPMDKSFLVLFFKKELLSSACLKHFFFEKKKQKTFVRLGLGRLSSVPGR